MPEPVSDRAFPRRPRERFVSAPGSVLVMVLAPPTGDGALTV